MRVGSGEFVYEVIAGWGHLPPGWSFAGDVPGLAVDSQDRVYVFNRGDHPLIVFDREGHYLDSWGEGLFKRPHGLFIDAEDAVYCVDDQGHAVHKLSPEGQLIWTIETANQPAETGYRAGYFSSVRRAGPPFNYPTHLALSPEGDLYVSDGYGNARIHKFTSTGQLLFSWGEPGAAPGQFLIPHGLCVDYAGQVYVADRENQRIQCFSPQGEFITQWPEVRRPNNMCFDRAGRMYVTELGLIIQGEPGQMRVIPDAPPARLTVRDPSGQVLAEWGATATQGEALYFAPHGLAIDSRGDLYVGEVAAAYSGGQAPADKAVLHKYVRV